MIVLDVVLREFSIVLLDLAFNEICRVGFLQQDVTHVLLILQDALDGLRAPVLIAGGGWNTQAYPKSEEKAITKTNNLSAKAGATNVTSNNGYVGGLFGGFHPSSMRVLRKLSISGGMVSSGCRTDWEGTA